MLRNLALNIQSQPRSKLLDKILLYWPIAAIFFSGLIFSRGVLLQELFPFGAGFLGGICLSYPSWALSALLGTALGYFLILPLEQALIYIISICCIYFFLYRSGRGKEHPFLASLFASSFHILVRTMHLLLTEATLYQVIAAVLEAIFIGIIILAVWYSAKGYCQWKSIRQFAIEGRCGVIILTLGLLLGLFGLAFCSLDVQSIICRYILLWAAYIGGPGAGAGVGVALGLLPIFQGSVPLGSVTFYASAGLLGGSFRVFNKAGTVVGFILANLFLAAYYAESVLIWRTLMETGVAVAFFCLLPVPWERLIDKEYLRLSSEDSCNIVQEKLARLGEAFLEIQDLMTDTNTTVTTDLSSDELIKDVCSQVCEGCSLWKTCWRKNKEKTDEMILSCGRKYHENKTVCERDLDPELLRRCPRSRELVSTIGNAVERFSLVRYYDRKLEGSRTMITQQLSGLGNLIQDLSVEVSSSQQICLESKNLLEQECQAHGIPIQQVSIIEEQEAYSEIRVIQSPCKDRKRCYDELLPLTAKVLGITHEIKELSCPVLGGSRCVCTLVPKAVLEIEIGQALCPKIGQSVSGDTAMSFQLPGKELGLVISDGMGTGLQAHAESAKALKLLERFLITGLSAKMSVKIVNTAMVLRARKETFATLDLVIINQVTGETEFIKAGGAPSLIWSKGNFQVITAGMPPAGILDQFDTKSFTKVLYPQDVVITMSDGTWEALEALEGRGQWLDRLMQQLALEKPAKIAEFILYLAKNGIDEGGSDDMCVQVARIGKRNIA